jgi:hypothetical protein
MRVSAEGRRHAAPKCLAVALLGAAMLLVVAGCATQEQVRQIVDESNSRLAASMLPDPGLAANGSRAKETGDTARRIDDLIAAHPDQKALAASLRVRQGVIYLNEGDFNLAEAAFEAADAGQLFTDRDRALKALAPHLVWWYRAKPVDKNLLPDAEFGRAEAAMAALKAQAAERKDSPDVRDWIAETRVWIGLVYVAAVVPVAAQKTALEGAIDDYAAIFSAADLQWLCAPSKVTGKAPLPEVRRRVRALTVVAQAKQQAVPLTGPNRPAFKEAVLQDLIAPTSPAPRCTGK